MSLEAYAASGDDAGLSRFARPGDGQTSSPGKRVEGGRPKAAFYSFSIYRVRGFPSNPLLKNFR